MTVRRILGAGGLCLLTLTALAGTSSAALEILVDIGGSAPPPTFGGTWNTIGTMGTSLLTVLDSSGSVVPGVRIETMGWTDTDIMTNPFDTWNKDWADGNAVLDFGYINMGSMPAVFVKGLQPGDLFNVEAVASVGSDYWSNCVADYKLNLNAATAPPSDDSSLDFDPHFDGRVQHDIMRWQYVASDAQGELLLTVHTRAPDYRGVLNAMRITLVPEPVSLTLLLIGLPWLIRRRLRR